MDPKVDFLVKDVMSELREIGDHHGFPMPDPEQQTRKPLSKIRGVGLGFGIFSGAVLTLASKVLYDSGSGFAGLQQHHFDGKSIRILCARRVHGLRGARFRKGLRHLSHCSE